MSAIAFSIKYKPNIDFQSKARITTLDNKITKLTEKLNSWATYNTQLRTSLSSRTQSLPSGGSGIIRAISLLFTLIFSGYATYKMSKYESEIQKSRIEIASLRSGTSKYELEGTGKDNEFECFQFLDGSTLTHKQIFGSQ